MVFQVGGKGFVAAEDNLGFCYSHGKGVAEDKIAGAKWYRKAADRVLPMPN